ncbi:MAG: hypothetical protein RR505_14040, partial [Raoultibacter sp.]
ALCHESYESWADTIHGVHPAFVLLVGVDDNSARRRTPRGGAVTLYGDPTGYGQLAKAAV